MSKPKKSFQQKGLSCFQLSKLPRSNDKLQQFVSLFSPSLREQPGKCLLYRVVDLVEGQSVVGTFNPLPIDIQMGKYPAGTEVAYKFGPLKPLQSLVVFRCTEVQMLWHHQSQALLVRSSFDDGSANSYYAETRLYVMYTDREPVAVHFGDASTKGDIHDVQWCPTGFEFCTLHGPAREASCILWYAKDCTAVRSIGAGAWNTIRYSPSGRLLLLAGFGSLAGRVDVWEKQKLVRLYRGMDSDSPQTIMWSPCGRYYLSGTIFPHLRVGNQLKVNRFDGKLLHKEVAKEPAIQKDIKSEKSEGFLGGVPAPSEGHFTQVSCNFYPRLNYFDDLKLAPEILDGAQKVMQAEAAKQPQALPPGVSKFSSAASRSKYSSNFEEQPQVNQPRDFIKERKQGGGSNNHSAEAVFSTKVTAQQQQQQQQPTQQQQQPKPQSNNNNNDFGSWRR